MQIIDLKDYEIPRKTVSIGRGMGISVRGLSLDDITFLIAIHHEPITRALKRYQEAKLGNEQTASITEYALTLVRDFPDLAVEVISAASDSLTDETRAKAKRLPITIQMAVLNEIVGLSLEEVGGLKNLLAEMRGRLQMAAESVGEK